MLCGFSRGRSRMHRKGSRAGAVYARPVAVDGCEVRGREALFQAASAMLVTLTMLGPSSLQDFVYEIGRAKGTLSVYAEHAYREEQIHLRTGRDGSTVETYCALTRTRTGDGRVEERPFYWVVRVRPQKGYLSDYERGAWQQPPPGELADYNKLCVNEAPISDSELLRSKEHSSSGSVYDPTADPTGKLSGEWLVGSWVSGDNCATSRDVLFRADGHYEGGEGIGRWSLTGTNLQLTITAKEALGDDGDPVGQVPKPKQVRVPVERMGIDRLRTHGKYSLLRC